MFEQGEGWSARSTEQSDRVQQHVAAEANEGRIDLLKQQRQTMDQLRNGWRDEATQTFGNLILLDSAEDAPSARTDKRAPNTGEPTSVRALGSNPSAEGGSYLGTDPAFVAGGVAKQDRQAGDRGTGNQTKDGHAHSGRRGHAGDRHGRGSAGCPGFPGEIINRDVPPGEQDLREGARLEDIARRHLGAGATDEEVRRHVREIERYNGIADSSRISGMSFITLPGHTRDGGFVSQEENGPRRIVWSNGAQRIENPDGTGHTRHPGPSGSYTEEHWGQRQEDNYTLSRTAAGRYMVTEYASTTPVDRTDSHDPRVERARWTDGDQTSAERAEYLNLYGLAQSQISNEQEREQFQADMLTFRQRARGRGLTPEEVARTYQQVGRLFQGADASNRTGSNRLTIAEQVMAQAADPTTVNQSIHGTCPVASLEARTYTRNPSAAAQLVADVAISGHYQTTDRTDVRITSDMLQGTEEMSHQRGDGTRSYASEIFQVTAVNIQYVRNGLWTEDGRTELADPGRVRYEQHPENVLQGDSGERLVDYSRSAAGAEVIDPITHLPARSPNLTENQLRDIGEQISGTQERPEILAGRERVGSRGYNLDHPVVSEQDLRETLSRMRREGRFPVIIAVHASNEPFYTECGAAYSGREAGWHNVTITDYDERSRLVSIDNQWGQDADHFGGSGISSGDLYLAMRPAGSPENIQILQRDVRWNEQHGTVDAYKEFELLRQRRLAGMEWHQYLEELRQTIDRNYERWAGRGDYYGSTFNRAENLRGRTHMLELLHEVVRGTPADQRDDVLSHSVLAPLCPADREEILADLRAWEGREAAKPPVHT